jgi:hypothetical protein
MDSAEIKYEPVVWFARLMDDSADARSVRRWVKAHAHSGIGRWSGAGLSDLDEELDRIAALMVLPHDIHPWDATPREDRVAWIESVQKAIGQLQERLADPRLPPLPPVAGLLSAPLPYRVRAVHQTHISDLLANLAGAVEALRHHHGPDARPNTGAPAARRFARFMAEYLVGHFGLESPPFATLAALVRIRFPGESSKAENIRRWFR